MSNPTVTFSNSALSPVGVSNRDRESWLQVVFSSQQFFLYAVNEYKNGGAVYDNFDPLDHGDRFYAFVPLGTAFDNGSLFGLPDLTRADNLEFVTKEAWDRQQVTDSDKRGLYWEASGFVNAVGSAMPKLVIPSKTVTENAWGDKDHYGKDLIRNTQEGGSVYKDPFGWSIVSGPQGVQTLNMGGVGPENERTGHYFSYNGKNDAEGANEAQLELTEPADPPTGNWTPSTLVVQGAFCLLLNVIPAGQAGADPDTVTENTWSIEINFGEVSMMLQQGGALQAKVGSTGGTGDNDGNTDSINLPEASAKSGPPQLANFSGNGAKYAIVVYPVWNGIVVTSGVQDVRPSVDNVSLFIPRLKEASILDPTWTANDPPFDPDSPDEVEVLTGSGVTNTVVDFGSTLELLLKNCKAQIAYLPCFFTPRMWMDEWFLGNSDTGSTEYTYDTWPIWTKNGTAYDFSPAYGVTDPSKPGEAGSDTKYLVNRWYLEEGTQSPGRHAPQIFGSILRTKEKLLSGVRNGNGAFDIVLDSTGTPGDPSPTSDWADYIQNVSVTISREGTSGSMTVDKYGYAGQEAVAEQSVGLVRLSVDGGAYTNLNSGGVSTGNTEFFVGFGVGIGENKGPDGATWNVPLVGLERKMDDIMLVNAPFVDGWTADDALKFLLLRYAGISYSNQAGAAVLTKLRISEDIESPVFNWTAGTTVRAAMDVVVQDVLLDYHVQGADCRVFAIGSDGFPINAGATDWQTLYPDVQLQTQDLTPVFDNIRNEIIVVGMEDVVQGSGTNIADLPLFPRVHVESQTTDPSFPWAKRLVHVTQGVLGGVDLEDVADNIKIASQIYDTTGSVTIPGNANILLYDKWGDLIITSITHNADLQAKTFTTDLELGGEGTI